MTIDVVMQDERWAAVTLETLAANAAHASLDFLGLDPDACECALLACDDEQIATLNAEFRGKPVPTNVLSWPAADLAADSEGAKPVSPSPDITGEIALGDIAISYDTCLREATETGKSLAHHTTHLIVHGLLHLLGYDHIRDRDATLMEETEVKILGTLGIDDPYSLD